MLLYTQTQLSSVHLHIEETEGDLEEGSLGNAGRQQVLLTREILTPGKHMYKNLMHVFASVGCTHRNARVKAA